MNIAELLNDKNLKPKIKTETLSGWLINNTISAGNLTSFAETAKDPAKATCIEALEFATKQNPAIIDEECFEFITQSLTNKAPRIKWESARVIGNTAKLFPNKLEKAITNLLDNAEHEGTVVRWSAAFALGEILKLKTQFNKDLIIIIEAVCEREEKNSIKKIYLNALKKANK